MLPRRAPRRHAAPPSAPARRLKVNFIFEKHKKRVTVAGMVGWTLLETAKHHGLPLHGARADSPWDYVTLGEGPGSVEDHIVLPVADFEKVGPCSWQEQELLDASAADHVQPKCAPSSANARGVGAASQRVSPTARDPTARPRSAQLAAGVVCCADLGYHT